jgi:hypothetical protein
MVALAAERAVGKAAKGTGHIMHVLHRGDNDPVADARTSAMAMAMSASVTVSIGELTIGTPSLMLRVT